MKKKSGGETQKIKRDFQDIYKKKYVSVPKEIKAARGIRVKGRKIRSILNSTDPVIVRNNNADAGMIVYPFTPEPLIIQSFINVSHMPLIIGAGGGTTTGKMVSHLALNAEFMGALAVIVNSPLDGESIKKVVEEVNIPVIATVVSERQAEEKITAGADIINVAAAEKTPRIVEAVKKEHEIQVMASAGPTTETILNTIYSGADAITYKPPGLHVLMSELMERYREMEE